MDTLFFVLIKVFHQLKRFLENTKKCLIDRILIKYNILNLIDKNTEDFNDISFYL